MLVRVADTERAREASENRASGLETWTLELEAKVAAARTRADDLETSSAALQKELDATKKDLDTAKKELDREKERGDRMLGELVNAQRDTEEALEAERVKRGLEIDALVEQHQAALTAAKREATVSRAGGVRDAMAKMIATLEEAEQLDGQTRALRMGVLDQARRALAAEAPAITSPPISGQLRMQTIPAMKAVRQTLPPASKRKRSKRPPAPSGLQQPTPAVSMEPTNPPTAPTNAPTAPGDKLVSFEDLDLKDE
jgi:chromosome segregation ATPase